MLNWESLSAVQFLVLAGTYVLGRATIFYTLFHFLYKAFNRTLGIAKDLPTEKQLRSERMANLKANAFEILVLASLGASGIIRFHEFSWTRFVGTFFFCYFFFELWFYCSHRLLHTKALLWAHRTHHLSVVTNPLSALSLSITEKAMNDVGMLLVPCLLTNSVPFVVEGILAYHLYNFYINVLGHSNIELFPVGFSKSTLGKLFTTSTYHSVHHIKSNTNYGLFLTSLDKLFGTDDPNYEQYYNSVVSSRGITRKELNASKSH